ELRQRCPGAVFGCRQHGLPLVMEADLAGDVRLLQQAQGAAEQLMIAHPGLEGAELAPLRARVDRMFAQAEGTLN
ncbi:MAG: ATP-dependent DNA helicase RecG, partial [Oscillospiraceae bacterium]|nr:ATP-dependent DNA helicase RecG [Oscillospiraceae bacterium]